MSDYCPISGDLCEKNKKIKLDFLNHSYNVCENCNVLKVSEKYNELTINEIMINFILLFGEEKKETFQQHCENCKSTLKEISNMGKFGCPECYTFFYEISIKLFEQFQEGNKKHIGKKPKNLSKDILEKELKKAIEEERYEDALKIKQIIDSK